MSNKLDKIFESDEHGLLNFTSRSKPQSSSDRLEASFLEINEFYENTGRTPSAKTTDPGERRLGARLLALKADEEKALKLAHLDTYGLLVLDEPPASMNDLLSDEDLGLFDDPTGILTIRNVPADVQRPDMIARAHKSKDFAEFEQGFKETHALLKSGELVRTRISSEHQIQHGRYYVLKGVLCYVADMAQKFASKTKTNARLRVIYENGTESNILLRSFARSLYREADGARVVPRDFESMSDWAESSLDSEVTEEDKETGYIYVLRSLSDNPQVQDIQDLYKIGFTTGGVETRVKGAETDPTYLMAPVEVVATYKCYNLNTQKLEYLLHRFFSEAKLDVNIMGPDGKTYAPAEWYVAPLEIIDRAVDLFDTGEIVSFHYDSERKDVVVND